MSRLIFCGFRERYASLAYNLLGVKHGLRSYSNIPILQRSNNNNISIFTTSKWLRNIQTETQTPGSSIPPLPPKGEVAKKLSQAPPLPTQENILEQTAKAQDLINKKPDGTSLTNTEKKEDRKIDKKLSNKPSLWVRFKNESLHYYHGFKLFFYEVKISTKLTGKILVGHSLTRREKRQLERTVADIFRLVPFSIFIIVPFLELLLPVAIKLFPGLLPSTFQTVKTKEEKIRAELKVKLQMSKFLRNTMAEMSELNEKKEGPTIHEFVEFFETIHEGENAHVDEVIRFSKLFRDEFTLDNMTHAQLQALCKLVMLNSVGTSALLRLQLKMCLRHLKADDNMIRSEGIDSMTISELQSACQARGMRAVGINEKKLKEQLLLWLNLHLDKQVPPSLLLLTQALTLRSHAPNPEGLGKTLSALPEELIDHLEAEVAKTPKTKLETLRNEQAKIEKEHKEHEIHQEEKLEKHVALEQEQMVKPVSEVLVDANTHHELTKDDVKTLSEAVDKLKNIHESIADIKTEMAEEEPKTIITEGVVEQEPEVTRSKAEIILAKKVTSIIADLETQISMVGDTSISSDHISTSDLTDTLLALKNNIGPVKMKQIMKSIDTDSDGFIHRDNLWKIIKLLASENTDVSTAHIKQITELIDREHLSIKLKQQL